MQLAKKGGAVSRATQEIFYPVCLRALGIKELQQLKQQLSSNGLKNLFFPVHDIQKVLVKKVRQGGTGNDRGSWLDALTTRELTESLLLFLVGAGCLIAGLVLGWMILTGIGVIPMLLGVGILVIPLGSMLWNRLTVSNEQNDTIEKDAIICQEEHRLLYHLR